MVHALALITLMSLGGASVAHGQKAPSMADLAGCWRIEGISAITGKRGGRDLCLSKDGKVGFWFWNWEEALGRGGRYSLRANLLTIDGSPGDGWPGQESTNQCTSALNTAENELRLENCAFKGAWKRACSKLSSKDGTLRCVQ